MTRVPTTFFAIAWALALCGLLVLFAAVPAAPPVPPPVGLHPWAVPEKGLYSVYIGRVLDGDTVEAYVLTGPVKLRMAAINAPEIHTPTGPASRDALKGQVEGKVLTAECHGLERYGRTLARLWLPGPPAVDVSQWMVSGGWAVQWDGDGPKP